MDVLGDTDLKVESLSASRIKTFYECQLKYHAVYELEVPEEEVHPLTAMGSAEHKMFELAAKARMAGERRVALHDPMVFKQAVMRKFKVESNLSGLMDELTANAVRWGYFRNIKRTVGCEWEFEFFLGDGTKVTGIIDRLDVFPPGADIIDIKTQKDLFSQEELRGSWQARIYNIATRKHHPAVTGKVSVSFWVLRHQVQKTYLTSHDAEADCFRLSEVASEIRACTDPKPSPSYLCRYCRYQDRCPASKMQSRGRGRR